MCPGRVTPAMMIADEKWTVGLTGEDTPLDVNVWVTVGAFLPDTMSARAPFSLVLSVHVPPSESKGQGLTTCRQAHVSQKSKDVWRLRLLQRAHARLTLVKPSVGCVREREQGATAPGRRSPQLVIVGAHGSKQSSAGSRRRPFAPLWCRSSHCRRAWKSHASRCSTCVIRKADAILEELSSLEHVRARCKISSNL